MTVRYEGVWDPDTGSVTIYRENPETFEAPTIAAGGGRAETLTEAHAFIEALPFRVVGKWASYAGSKKKYYVTVEKTA
jgi:hypothetical protein